MREEPRREYIPTQTSSASSDADTMPAARTTPQPVSSNNQVANQEKNLATREPWELQANTEIRTDSPPWRSELTAREAVGFSRQGEDRVVSRAVDESINSAIESAMRDVDVQ